MYLLILNTFQIAEQKLYPCGTAVSVNNKSSAGLVDIRNLVC